MFFFYVLVFFYVTQKVLIHPTDRLRRELRCSVYLGRFCRFQELQSIVIAYYLELLQGIYRSLSTTVKFCDEHILKTSYFDSTIISQGFLQENMLKMRELAKYLMISTLNFFKT